MPLTTLPRTRYRARSLGFILSSSHHVNDAERSLRRNGTRTQALALILAAYALTLTGVESFATVLVLFRRTSTFPFARVLAVRTQPLATVQAFTRMFVSSVALSGCGF